MVKKSYRKNSNNLLTGLMVFAIIGVVALIGILLMNQQFSVGGEVPSTGVQTTTGSNVVCPADLSTGLFVEIQNVLNSTGAEVFDATVYVLSEDGSIVTTITDTTSPATATSLQCGKVYELAVLSSSTTNSQIKSILANSGSDAQISSGKVRFTASGSTLNLRLGVEQHGSLEFRMYDNDKAQFSYNSASATNVGYTASGVTYRDGDNATAFAVGDGDRLDFTLSARTILDDEDFQDGYIYMAVKLPVDKWDEPIVRLGGSVLSEAVISMDAESKALSSYEYVYRFDRSMVKSGEAKIDLQFEALTGQNPTADIEIDFFTAGNYLMTSGTGIGFATHKDDSSRTAVFTKQGVVIDVQ